MDDEGVRERRGRAVLVRDEAIHGAGGLRSNVEDMLKYLKANVGPPKGPIWSGAMAEAHKVRSVVKGDLSIGLGWQIQQYQGRSIVGHGGGTGGFTTAIGFDPDKRVGVVMLTNTTQFADDVAQDFLRRGPPLAIPEVKVASKVLETYVGAALRRAPRARRERRRSPASASWDASRGSASPGRSAAD